MPTLTKRYSGFTIVELLIVIVVIAILATISIVAYRGIQNRAYDTAVEADMAAITRKLELAKVDAGHYPYSLAEFPDFKFNKSVYYAAGNNVYYIVDIDNDVYAVGLKSKSGKNYILNTGVVTVTGSTSAANTASAINKTWVGDGTNFRIQGYFYTTPRWESTWSWTSD